MNALITGASGFLGGHMAELFAAAGHRVRALVRNTSNTEFLERLGVEIVRGDLKDSLSLRRAVKGVEVVVNAASTMAAPAQEIEEATVKGTRALLAAAEEAGVTRFIHISSIGIYAMHKLPRGATVNEDSPLETDPALIGHYTRSKIESERAALEFAGHGKMKVLILRPGIMYGPRGKWTLPRMGYPVGMKRYVLVGRGRNPLPVCYVRNCAKAALSAAEANGVAGGVFNIVDDERFTAIGYLRRLRQDVRPGLRIMRFPYFIARALGWCAERVRRRFPVPNPFNRAHLTGCHLRQEYSNERAKAVLGWRPEVGGEEALAATMQYFADRERVSRRADLRVLGRAVAGAPPVTVCLIGCGGIAAEHLRILDRMDNARVLALCDASRDAALRLGERFKVFHTYSDPVAMIEAEKPQVVHILTPPQSHSELTEMAAARGCHVLVEKPMAVDAREARRMADVCARSNVQLCVDHNRVYDPVMVNARRLIESGAVGDVLWVESYYGFDLGGNPACRYMLPGGEKHWTFELPGGMYQNFAPHPLSVALDILGKPGKVHAFARYGRVLPHAPTDELRIFLETPRALGLVTVSFAAGPGFEYVNVVGTRMALHVDLRNKWLIPQGTAGGMPKPISRALMNLRYAWTVTRGTIGGTVKVLRRRWTDYDGMELLIREFYASLQDKGRPPVTADDGICVMETMDAAWAQVECKPRT